MIGSFAILMKLGCTLIILRSYFSLLDETPLFLGTYISLEYLFLGVLSIILMEEKGEPKLLMISSNLSILAVLCSTLLVILAPFPSTSLMWFPQLRQI